MEREVGLAKGSSRASRSVSVGLYHASAGTGKCGVREGGSHGRQRAGKNAV